VREAAIDRAVRGIARQVAASHEFGYGLLAEAQRRVLEIKDHSIRASVHAVEDVCGEVLRAMEERRAGNAPSGLATGVPEFDSYLNLAPGGLIVIAGRPSMGKSSFGQWLTHRLLEQGERVLVFTTESHRAEYTARFLSRLSGVNPMGISRGNLGWEGSQRVKEAADKLRALPLFIDDTTLELPQIVRQIRRAKSHHGVTAVVLDHLQEVTHSKLQARDQELVNATLREVRAVAREDPKLYTVIVSQLNRAVESREGKRPIMADLRASGKIEEVADMILLLFRGAYYFPESDEALLEIAVAKNRNGTTGVLKFAWDGANGHCLGPLADRYATGGSYGR
jgi:replicative DNA helicase